MTSQSGSQNIVTLKVTNLNDAIADFSKAWASTKSSAPSIAFASWDLMHKTLSPKKLALLKALCGQEPISIRELARRVGRDFKGVHTDVIALVNTGMIEKEGTKISFPYDGIHVEFDIGVAA
jgi:predicted transcriptional regulator